MDGNAFGQGVPELYQKASRGEQASKWCSATTPALVPPSDFCLEFQLWPSVVIDCKLKTKTNPFFPSCFLVWFSSQQSRANWYVVKIPTTFFTEIWKPVLKFTQRNEQLNNQSTLEQKEWGWNITKPDVELYYRVTVTNSVVLAENR